MSEEMKNDATPETADTTADTPADTTAKAPAETPAPAAEAPAPAEKAVTSADVAGALGASAPAASTATVVSTATVARTIVTKPASGGWFWGTGRRKAAVARVRLKAGKGEFKINYVGGPEIVPRHDQHEAVKNGVLDMAFIVGADLHVVGSELRTS